MLRKKKSKPPMFRMEKWNLVLDEKLETNLCVYRDFVGDWEAFPVYVLYHGQLGKTRWRCDSDRYEVFFDNKSEPERPRKLPLDDPKLIEELEACVANIPKKLFGSSQLSAVYSESNPDGIICIVAKKVPELSPTICNPKSASQPVLAPA